MNRTLLVCSIAAFSLSAPALAGSQGAAPPGSSYHRDNTADRPAGYYSKSGSQVQRFDRSPSDSMSQLTDAAQRLREAIQQIAQHSSDDQRDAAIRSAHRALFDTQQAMIDLPPELRRGSTRNRGGEQDYNRSMEKLTAAAQSLRESAQAMAQQPAGERRNQAVDQVNEAILEINQAMVQLPWEPTAHGSASTSSGNRDGRRLTSSLPTFDRIDANSDGMLSRQEYRNHMDSSAGHDGASSQATDVSTQPNRPAAGSSGDQAAGRSEGASTSRQASR